ncbi:MAG: isoprenylcysteine carboxylmethyltransferase family protein [Gammaproteobacteria bacterium]|nr:isoprenylcysteine carboxylmethyltransferase family protein [Gammaproteobacteria bacterium]MDH5803156.1 isoprenylcysteine carboxylmethyltransferase family protein [Gammaproteobacteria bacterium]
MFTAELFSAGLDQAARLTATLLVSTVFAGMSLVYTRKRARRHYAQTRLAAPSLKGFGIISKSLFVGSMVLTLLSLWLDAPWLLKLHDSSFMQLWGSMMVFMGFLGLQKTFRQLGQNYSPSFDAYIPATLLTQGMYHLVRHPVYLFNLFVSFGLALASGSVLVLLCALTGLVFVLRIIAIEEQYLKLHFPEYEHYAKRTDRLLPYCY